MNRLPALLTAAVIVMVVVAPARGGPDQGRRPDDEQERLRHRLEASEDPLRLEVADRPLYCAPTLLRFYRDRTYQPAWTDGERVVAAADSLLAAIRDCAAEGLEPADYHLSAMTRLRMRLPGKPDPADAGASRYLVDLELLLTDAYLLLGSHYVAGRIDPETLDPEWNANRRQVDLARYLEDALAARRLGASLRELLPPQTGYARLRDLLEQYRRIAKAGGWRAVPDGPKLQRDDRSDRVAALIERLRVTGDFVPEEPLSDRSEPVLDATLEQAVRRFQRRHGLDTDGVVGPLTLKALNVPIGARITQILVNLERWRWLPQELGRRYVLVNIADFRLKVVENDRSALAMTVIVGRPYRRTPVFSADMSYLVFNPSWEVPPKLAVQDKLPLLRKDPNSLRGQGFRLLQGWGAEEQEIDPETVDWSKVSQNRFPYRLRQMPGPANALGRIKFMFPNKFDVYLHDTPSRELFSRSVRMFSSGCIRVSDPLALAVYLLQGNARWSQEAIAEALDSGREQTVRLPAPVPVHLLYWTAWVDADGTAQFRDDVYDRDRPLASALFERPPDELPDELPDSAD